MNNTPDYPLDLQLFRHARHAYAPSGTPPSDAVMPGLKLFVPFTSGHDYAYLALYENLVVLSFRGSNLSSADPMDGIQDWLSNFNCRMVDWEIGGKTIKTHSGFLDAWTGLRPQIFAQLTTIQTVRQMPIVCVGHSRGTMAGLAALEISTSYADTDLLTWGAPLLTDQAGADLSRAYIRREILYVNRNETKRDPVATMPIRGPQRGDPLFIRWDGLVEMKAGEAPEPVRHSWALRLLNRFGRWVFGRMRQSELSPEVIEQTAYLHEPALYGKNMMDSCTPPVVK